MYISDNFSQHSLSGQIFWRCAFSREMRSFRVKKRAARESIPNSAEKKIEKRIDIFRNVILFQKLIGLGYTSVKMNHENIDFNL